MSQSKPWFEHQQDLNEVTKCLDAPNASKNPKTVVAVAKLTRSDVEQYMQLPGQPYTPPVTPEYRRWGLRTATDASLSPVALFLRFFGPILLLLRETNITARAATQAPQTWKDVTETEIRRWLAVRLDMVKNLSFRASKQSFWDQKRPSTRSISWYRFLAIERHLSLESMSKGQIEATTSQISWFWRVQRALDLLRYQLHHITIPGSHLVVDESAIKFHGRKQDKYRLPNKPAKEGFIFYAVTSHGGLVHDFMVSSSQDHLEGVPDHGITINTPTRTVRSRQRGAPGLIADDISLPAQKSMVYLLIQRVTTEWRINSSTSWVCYLDNLFVDVYLARALLTIGVGICGTTRKNVPGVPNEMLALVHCHQQLLPPNHTFTRIIDEFVNVTAWHDPLRNNHVLFLSTVHLPGKNKTAQRKMKARYPIRTRPDTFEMLQAIQPAIAVDYNTYMGATDNANHLRAIASIVRPGEPKWTRRILAYIIDICHCNAYLIYLDARRERRPDHRDREIFLNELVEGLLEIHDKPHIAAQHSSRRFCTWRACRATPNSNRRVLADITNSARKPYASRTADYCKQCGISLCVTKGCFEAYHNEKHLPMG
jgi:hypothetical protein